MIRSVIQGITQIQPKFLGQPSLTSPLRALAACDVQSILPPAPHNQQVRTTFILRRKNPIRLSKVDKPRRLKSRDFIYELVENTNCRKSPPVKLILTEAVEGVGSKGDVVKITPAKARRTLLQGLAVYASPENLEKYTHILTDTDENEPSSPFAKKTATELSSRVIGISMNMYNPWKIEPWHIRVAFRRAGIIVPENALTLPTKPIEGPDMNLEGKEFLVRVKVNNKEEAPVRCRIHHHTLKAVDRLPYTHEHWLYAAEPIFLEEASILSELTTRNRRTLVAEEE